MKKAIIEVIRFDHVMGKAFLNTSNPSVVALGFITVIILMFVTSTALVLGTVCKYVANMCKKLCAKRKKHSKNHSHNNVALKPKQGLSMPHSGSPVVKHQFSIPKSKSDVLAQPTFSQRVEKSSTDDSSEGEAK